MVVPAQEMGTSLSDPGRGAQPVRVLAPSGNSPNQLAVGADGEVGYYYVPSYPAPSEGDSNYDRRDRDADRSYYVEEDKDVRVGRPLYDASTFTLDPMMAAERNNPENIRRRRAAEAEIEFETKRDKLLLERREIINESLKNRTDIKARDLKLQQDNEIEADAMGFMDDFGDLKNKSEVTWPAILELQKTHPAAFNSPQVKDILNGYEPMRVDWERQQTESQAEQQKQRQAEEAAALAVETFGRSERSIYEDQISRGATPTTALSVIERRRAYEKEYDKFTESGVPTEVLDRITVGEPETGEVGFDPGSLRKLRIGLSAITLKGQQIKEIDDDVKAIQDDAKNSVSGVVSFTGEQSEVLEMLEQDRAKLLKDRILLQRQLLSPPPSGSETSSAHDLVIRVAASPGSRPAQTASPSRTPSPTRDQRAEASR